MLYIKIFTLSSYTKVKRKMQKKRIVVLGGGIAGIEFLTRLSSSLKPDQFELMLIDKSEYHIWKPMLHTFAAGSAKPNEQGINFLIQAKRSGYLFNPGTVSKINLKQKKITLKALFDSNNKEILPERIIDFDYLVIAMGSQTNDFNIKGVKEYAYPIDDLDHALTFYNDLKNCIIQAAILKEKHHVVIVGAGATGVELSGEIIYQLRQSSQYVGYDFTDYLHLTVVQSGDQILPSFKKEIGNAVKKTMNEIGINTLLSARVKEITKDHVYLGNGEVLPADQVVWTTGIKGEDLLHEIDGAESSKRSQVIVTPRLQVVGFPYVFAMGDCSSIQDNPLPPTSQVATQQASYLSRNFFTLIQEPSSVEPFKYKDYGSLVSVGQYQSFGVFGHHVAISGWIAKMAHLFLYRSHQIRILGLRRAISAILADKFRKFSL